MDQSRQARERADTQFDNLTRAEKGSALTMIRAEAEARHEKTARLRALRLAREAVEQSHLPKAKPASRVRKKRAR